ncbi:MAG: hypothetical protein SPJ13_02875 [Bacteroidales bacterium]|nr:hypothetical protein [Bacteroidales bacterium]
MEAYVPPLMRDEVKLLSDKNPSLEHSECRLWLAYRNGQVVGRVAGIVNHLVNEHWKKRAVRFGWFDFVEDIEVCKALLFKVMEFGKERGLDQIDGPLGFNDLDKECWVIDNFEGYQNSTTLFNPKYYVDFIKELGFSEVCRWQQYKMPASQPVPVKVGHVNELILKKYNLKLLHFKKRSEIWPYANQFFPLLNKAFSGLYDFVPLTDKEIQVYIKEYFPFVNLDFANFVIDENDKLIAFGLSIPSLAKAYKKANGRLFPFGWVHLLHALRKFDTIDLLLNGVDPDWQKRGVHSIYYAEMNNQAIKHRVHTAYTNPQIIGNEAEKLWQTTYKVESLMQRAVFSKKME